MVGKWLLCDFHIHTTFSDGTVTLEETVNLYGGKGFDVIGISDHILDGATVNRCRDRGAPIRAIEKDCFPEYLRSLWKEARRAWEKFGLLIIPGIEITNNTQGYHILAIDIKEYIDPGLPVEEIVTSIHEQGGIAVAPHPHRGAVDGTGQLMYLWDNHERFVHLFDAWEVANRDDLFNVVGLKKFNYVANSDFHEQRHVYSWKTLLHCEKNTEAVKAAIRENKHVSIYLFRENKHINHERNIRNTDFQ
jgi:predicted metal-dependent phosphoesterase TrpH